MSSDPIEEVVTISLPTSVEVAVVTLKVQEGERVKVGTHLCSYKGSDDVSTVTIKSPVLGVVKEIRVKDEDRVPSGDCIMRIMKYCDHSVVAFDLCAICGLNVKRGSEGVVDVGGASVSMLHSIPQVKVSREEAERVGDIDKKSLLSNRKLALIVDLDQTLIHTSVDTNIQRGLPDVYGFKLHGHPFIYHCRLRPHARQFLSSLSSLYQLHVFTMGTRDYANSIIRIIDKDKNLFSDRVISRDDLFDPHSKAMRLKSVFPSGDEMVAIIDDREDVWGHGCPNLVHVKPYVFFAGTGDINAPPNKIKNVGGATTNVGGATNDVGVATNKVGGATNNIGGATNNMGGATNNMGGATKDVKETFKERAFLTNSNSNNNCENGNGNHDNGSDGNGSNGNHDNGSDGNGSNGNHGNGGNGNHGNGSDGNHGDTNPEGNQSNSTSSSDTSSSDGEDSSSSSDNEDTKDTSQKAEPTKTTPSNPTPQVVDKDEFLLHLMDILQRVHQLFYTEYDDLVNKSGGTSDKTRTPDLKVIIPRLRQSVLEGTRLLFTGVIPTNIKLERSREWNTSRAFGATVHTELIKKGRERTTHVIAGKKDTVKYKDARRVPGVRIVSPSWFWDCAERWRRVEETSYLLEPVIVEMETSTARERIRGMALERKFSVSSEELEKMEAEIDAELESEEDEDEGERDGELGSLIEGVEDEYERRRNSLDDYLGLEPPDMLIDSKGCRKRKRCEVDDMSSDSMERSSNSSGSSSNGDELAELLGLS